MTHFAGPVISVAGFAVPSTAYAASGAIDPAVPVANLTKTTPAGAFTIAAPGTANVGKFLSVFTTAALAHVTTVTGLLGGTTLTLAAAAGAGFTLYAVSATVWAVISLNGATQS